MFRRFRLRRDVDVSGVSGRGYVAKGLELWRGGLALMLWSVPDKPRSLVIFGSSRSLVQIHGHQGATRLEWRR